MDALGLGYDRLCELKPDIILCSISTFGQTGPLSATPGYDFIAQAYSGITSMVGEPGEVPALTGAAIGDASTGVHGALGVLAALRRRDRTGKGDHLDVSILDTYYSYHDANVGAYSGSGGELQPTRQGSHFGPIAPCGIFKANGGFIVIMSFLHHWPDFCRAMEREDMIDHPDWKDDSVRVPRRDQLTAIIEEWLAKFPSVDAAIEKMKEHDVPCAPVLSVAETTENPHIRSRGTVRTVDDPLHGKVDIPGMPIRWKNHPNNIEMTAPTLGQHNEEILRERLGKSDAEIAALRADGILFEKEI